MTGGLKVAFFIWRKNMRELWNMLQAAFTGIGGWLGYFLGGCDGLLYALIAFTVIDYISGVMCGIVDGKLSSSIGFKAFLTTAGIGRPRCAAFSSKLIPSFER